ncbi:hypothetical protein CB1_000350020 [Camelus ferus]|nr:hypothetical protein CB1_000350020 [Camelus ferus]
METPESWGGGCLSPRGSRGDACSGPPSDGAAPLLAQGSLCTAPITPPGELWARGDRRTTLCCCGDNSGKVSSVTPILEQTPTVSIKTTSSDAPAGEGTRCHRFFSERCCSIGPVQKGKRHKRSNKIHSRERRLKRSSPNGTAAGLENRRNWNPDDLTWRLQNPCLPLGAHTGSKSNSCLRTLSPCLRVCLGSRCGAEQEDWHSACGAVSRTCDHWTEEVSPKASVSCYHGPADDYRATTVNFTNGLRCVSANTPSKPCGNSGTLRQLQPSRGTWAQHQFQIRGRDGFTDVGGWSHLPTGQFSDDTGQWVSTLIPLRPENAPAISRGLQHNERNYLAVVGSGKAGAGEHGSQAQGRACRGACFTKQHNERNYLAVVGSGKAGAGWKGA